MRKADQRIILDVLQDIEGDSNPQSRMNKLLMQIVVELRVLNGRHADSLDSPVADMANTALKNITNFRK